MEIKKLHVLGMITAAVTIILNLVFLLGEDLFWFILGLSMLVAGLPFILTIVLETNRDRERGEMFIEFSRDLVENVRAGTPISKSILNLKGKEYGSLSPHVRKLANQIALGITVKEAMNTFSKDVNNRTITRAVALISESEQAGGDIESILEAVAVSVTEIEKLKKERKAAIYNLVVQGYIIFLVFIVIMLIMQFKILAMIADVANESQGGNDLGMIGFRAVDPEELSRPFLYLLITQGFFAGLVIGKLAEGNIKAGIKHSFILVILAWLISTGANLWMG